MNEAPRITHRAHLRKADLDQHGYTDRCPPILRGLNVHPHSAHYRHKMETAMASDLRVKSAKAGMQEKFTTMKGSPNEIPDTAKRKKREDIEDQAMNEEDPTKHAELFELYTKLVPREP